MVTTTGLPTIFGAQTLRKPEDLAQDDWRRMHPRFSGENFETMAQARGVTAAQLALAWVMAQGDHIVPIPGTRSVAARGERRGDPARIERRRARAARCGHSAGCGAYGS
jgi:hypothetical protein